MNGGYGYRLGYEDSIDSSFRGLTKGAEHEAMHDQHSGASGPGLWPMHMMMYDKGVSRLGAAARGGVCSGLVEAPSACGDTLCCTCPAGTQRY